jgi:hypothetical protein
VKADVKEQIDLKRARVDVDHFDLTVREVVRLATERELHRAPLYQRKFRWNEETESRLIESLFLGLPVPSLFVAANPEGTWELVDGLQRVSTLLHFAAPSHEVLADIGRGAPLVLEGLEEIPGLNGLEYVDLPEPVALGFMKRLIRVTVLSDKSDFEVRFDLFERLNRGGIALTPQEVRSCVYQGPFNDLLRELAGNPEYLSLLKLQKKHQEDGTAEEIVLKFFAYLHDREHFDGAVTAFLNSYMGKATTDFSIEDGRALFIQVVAELSHLLDGPILRAGYGLTPVNQLEAILVGAAEVLSHQEHLESPPEGWLNDEELVAASTKGTNTASMLNRRIERARQLLSS